jgi:sodium-dependent dicarboxylate transporter 2/3/5
MTSPPAAKSDHRPAAVRALAWTLALVAVATAASLLLPDVRAARAAAIVGACVLLWVTEAIPLYATTLILWAAIALLLGPVDPKLFGLNRIFSSAANPVMGLFFGGFALSLAASKYGLDVRVAAGMVRASRGRRRLLLAGVMGVTAFLSMWMSNIAAAAMMFATHAPLLATAEDRIRNPQELGVAVSADFGGMATPVGTGPNLIAIAAVADRYRITFAQWMLVAGPITLLMLALAYAVLARLHRVGGTFDLPPPARSVALGRQSWLVVALFAIAITMWLTEPLHGGPAAVIAMAVAAALFATRLLDTTDLARLEWDTLLLIAGGLTLGELFQDSGLARLSADALTRATAHAPALLLAVLLLGCALFSAVASNTAAAATIVAIALSVIPHPWCAVLVALAASMGVPFVISTPPNSMAYRQGHLRPWDLRLPGTILTLAGLALLATVGPTWLRFAGIP